MIYFYDTEFIEDGETINLISIGIVSLDGREYYAVNSDMDVDRIKKDDWLCANVVPHLPLTGKCEKFQQRTWIWSLNMRDSRVKPEWVIANEVRDFLLEGATLTGSDQVVLDAPELWAYYGAYDHVALMQLWGKMIRKPEGIPMFTHNLIQLIEPLGGLDIAESSQHDALADARWNRELYRSVVGV